MLFLKGNQRDGLKNGVFLYAENRILPSDTITQAKEKLKKEKETYKLLRERKRKWN
ncbi:TPA: hypothetical protein RTJ24_001504 [Campylobacter upsaliensis]|nr:hypothetical protein [Campylobacter upsaliensis]